jgi:hypothetical protein
LPKQWFLIAVRQAVITDFYREMKTTGFLNSSKALLTKDQIVSAILKHVCRDGFVAYGVTFRSDVNNNAQSVFARLSDAIPRFFSTTIGRNWSTRKHYQGRITLWAFLHCDNSRKTRDFHYHAVLLLGSELQESFDSKSGLRREEELGFKESNVIFRDLGYFYVQRLKENEDRARFLDYSARQFDAVQNAEQRGLLKTVAVAFSAFGAKLSPQQAP